MRAGLTTLAMARNSVLANPPRPKVSWSLVTPLIVANWGQRRESLKFTLDTKKCANELFI